MSEVSLFDSPAENPVDVEGPTAAALLGDAGPVRQAPEAVEALAATGVDAERCPSCGVVLPDEKHMVDRARRSAEKNRPQP